MESTESRVSREIKESKEAGTVERKHGETGTSEKQGKGRGKPRAGKGEAGKAGEVVKAETAEKAERESGESG